MAAIFSLSAQTAKKKFDEITKKLDKGGEIFQYNNFEGNIESVNKFLNKMFALFIKNSNGEFHQGDFQIQNLSKKNAKKYHFMLHNVSMHRFDPVNKTVLARFKSLRNDAESL